MVCLGMQFTVTGAVQLAFSYTIPAITQLYEPTTSVWYYVIPTSILFALWVITAIVLQYYVFAHPLPKLPNTKEMLSSDKSNEFE